MSAVRDVVVIGGGLAGAACAQQLAASGRDVVVVEREAGPHDKVCGEFLSGEAVSYLHALGVDLDALGAVPIRTVRLSHGGLSSARALPFPALSLSRRALDEALLARAAAAGAEVRRGSAVQELGHDGAHWTVRLENGAALTARHAILATGKHDLRDRGRAAGRQNDLIGLKRHFQLTPDAMAALEGTVELGLFPGGYAGLEPIERGLANLCLLVRAETFAAHGRDWARLLGAIAAAAPVLGARLANAVAIQDRPLAIARIPYGLVRETSGDGIWRLGDQAAVIPSFAGEGMSIALHSARLAARALLAGEVPETFQRRLADDVRRQVRLATGVSRALVRPKVQSAALHAARLIPAALSTVATATRLTPAALAAAA